MTDITTNLTGQEVLSKAYPGQYYGIVPDATPDASGWVYITAVVDTHDAVTDLKALPAASSMVALTQSQFAQARLGSIRIPVLSGALVYAARYAASVDRTATPQWITGWFDLWNRTSYTDIPDAATLTAVTPDQWNDPLIHANTGIALVKGAITRLGSVTTTNTPSETAAALVPMIEQEIMTRFLVRSLAIPAEWSTYLKDLEAAAADPSTASLPERPATA